MRKLENGMLFWHMPSEKGTCTWHMLFEHVHIKEGPRDAGKKRIGISRSGGRVIAKTKVSKKGNGRRMEERMEELVILRADFS